MTYHQRLFIQKMSHGWSTTKMKDMIAMQTIKQNPEIKEEKVFERKMELD